MCKVGDATWLSVAEVLGPPKPAEAQHSAPLASPVSLLAAIRIRAETEARYKNLAGVGAALTTWGGILKVLAVVIFGAGVLGVIFGFGEPWIAGVGVMGVLAGVIVAVLGMLIAAVGEALLALKDIAVNTRITADVAQGHQ